MSDHHCQQYELYASEAGLPRGREFGTAAELQAWVDNLREQPWWQRFYPQVTRVEASFKPSGRCSVGGWTKEMNAGRIEMLPCHRCELIVCHELAHVLASARYGSRSHDPWFARVYVELVFFVMGTAASTALLEAFKAHGIEHDPPREQFEFGRARFELGATI